MPRQIKREITFYVTTDGEEWHDEIDALDHQKKIDGAIDETFDHGISKGDRFYLATNGYVTIIEVTEVYVSPIEEYRLCREDGKWIKEDCIEFIDLSKPNDKFNWNCIRGKERISCLKKTLEQLVKPILEEYDN
ncbi:hypothetical protein H6G33_10270 [Calothrix sp. FACHB-1219]|uniref:hypothetical protein n=1 Tax=unclassified Calothrix TaxID=2619626 RepID=UPI0016874000|nr:MULTISPECIES: hypothetical protein [unclassified Calothrix]MBD2201732.1 hypothetical protein [Calothrix sp. FACHB-168]MBD2217418.1 hypothetical protein [Calothrix sp. FACHB-1219]